MVDRQVQYLPRRCSRREHRPCAVDPDLDRAAQELQARVLLQGTGEQAGLSEDLETVADAQHRPACLCELADGTHQRAEPGDGARAQIVAVGEAAREDDGVDVAQGVVAVPQQLGLTAGGTDGFDHVVLAVRARKDDDADVHYVAPPSMVMSAASITGFVRKRWQRSSTRDRAVSTSGASTVKRMALPTRTPSTPSNPRAGRARSMVAPWGSAMPGRNVTSTSTGNWAMLTSPRPPPIGRTGGR